MEEIYIPGVGDISREVEAEFRRGFMLEATLAEKRQREAALVRKEMGLISRGNVKLHIDPWLYHYWGQRESYEIWGDEKEVERFVRDTPELQFERERANTVSFAGCEGLVEGRPANREEQLLVS